MEHVPRYVPDVRVVSIERDTSRFRRRVLGFMPGQGRCHSQIELSLCGRFLLLHLASVAPFSVVLDRRSARKLLHALAGPAECRVPVCAWNNDSERSLTVRIHTERETVPALFYSSAPAAELLLGSQIRLVFPGEQLRALRRDLTAAYLQLEQP